MNLIHILKPLHHTYNIQLGEDHYNLEMAIQFLLAFKRESGV